MKRAHLPLPAAPPAPDAADLTDRLLDGAKGEERKAKSEKQKAKGRYAKQKAQPQTPELSAPSSADSSASIRSSVDSSADSSVASPLDTALTQSRAAVDALHAAAAEAPARYSVALRYRLDALAHHLTQITEFIETLRK